MSVSAGKWAFPQILAAFFLKRKVKTQEIFSIFISVFSLKFLDY